MADGGGRHPAEGDLRSDAALVGAVLVPFLVGGLVIGVSRWVAVVGVVLPVIYAHLPVVVGRRRGTSIRARDRRLRWFLTAARVSVSAFFGAMMLPAVLGAPPRALIALMVVTGCTIGAAYGWVLVAAETFLARHATGVPVEGCAAPRQPRDTPEGSALRPIPHTAARPADGEATRHGGARRAPEQASAGRGGNRHGHAAIAACCRAGGERRGN